ncbi:MAG: toll/interleukin-1 receptor domain-containing protein [Ktedonobacteraceae bacterium]
MTTIFLSSAKEDSACTDVVRQGLEAAGYTIWREPDYPTPRDVSYPYLIENAILGSAAVVVLWSQSAASFAWTKRHILIAQRFFKPLVPITLDETALPSTLLLESLSREEPYSAVVSALLPRLPAPDSTDPYLALCEQASHQYIRVRKETIDQAAAMLQRGEHREEVLAILEYLAHNDLMNGVREQAQAVLDAEARRGSASPAAPVRSQDSRHRFGARCQNGHISYFDKREVCAAKRPLVRGEKAAPEELLLHCPTCGVVMAVDVDCEGY